MPEQLQFIVFRIYLRNQVVVSLEEHLVWCVKVIVHEVFSRLCTKRVIRQLSELSRASQVLKLQLSEVWELFFVKYVLMM